MTPNWKPCATARKKKKFEDDRKAKSNELANKREARRRDGHRCRFPLCGCRRLNLALEARLEVSHQTHKGASGDPTGVRSTPDLLLTLCKHRHQDGGVSRHKGTMRARYLTSDKANGPVAWDVAARLVWPNVRGDHWIEVAREVKVQQLEPLSPKQQVILERLAEMDL